MDTPPSLSEPSTTVPTLGEPITPGKRAAMWARLGTLNIEISHWERSPRQSRSPGSTCKPEALAAAVAASESVAGVLRRLGGIGPQWLGKALTLAVDHINGDWTDNRLGNLRFLCPNCHAQTSTWCRRKGS